MRYTLLIAFATMCGCSGANMTSSAAPKKTDRPKTENNTAKPGSPEQKGQSLPVEVPPPTAEETIDSGDGSGHALNSNAKIDFTSAVIVEFSDPSAPGKALLVFTGSDLGQNEKVISVAPKVLSTDFEIVSSNFGTPAKSTSSQTLTQKLDVNIRYKYVPELMSRYNKQSFTFTIEDSSTKAKKTIVRTLVLFTCQKDKVATCTTGTPDAIFEGASGNPKASPW